MTKSKNPIFGLTGSGGRSFRGGSKGNTRFTGRRDSRGRGGGASGSGGQDAGSRVLDKIRADEGTALQERAEEVKVWDEIDEKQGFWRFESGKAGGEEREGWLVNMHQVGAVCCVGRTRTEIGDRRRRCSSRSPTRPGSQRSTTTLSRTTESHSRRPCRLSRTFS